MSEKWQQVDSYIVDKLVGSDDTLDAILQNNARAGLPAHDVAPNQGKLLALFAQMVGAKRILEIGTLGAYSTVWLARALPEGGEVVTLEADQHHAQVARQNIELAGLQSRIKLRQGPALDTLPALIDSGPFDMIFIDADKPNNPHYLQWALKLSRPGTLIIGDNVVRDGEVVNPASDDDRVQGVRSFFDLIAEEPRLSATALQTVGSKGWDGFLLARVL
ncbi:MAG: O-methyltransferase [Ewingella americana]|jgi:predicted O-methyltransferase YrrM|uniref:O-methyltransferase n=1 Tax=Ewingella americana TaxID=41202 RepID=UPI00242EACF8|nr:O-methyltransferase [Ewingella americana]MCI1680339.1 O-methyltransferase [Ewingella americana]MCI1854490.1 O-methyltransferase [Ewingella americana]MCI1860735.1 O-methyltransferase [Ewingella americana]MCI2143861.1 O-methyltransferase [Ewingella americana]MCI2164249.1 O-methyltransferase [Ewingella americana]